MKKLKKTITDSSQAKIGGKMLRKREKKNYRSVSFHPDGQEKIPKKLRKIQKIENTITASFQGKIGWKTLRMEKIKIIATFCSFPTGKRKFQKK